MSKSEPIPRPAADAEAFQQVLNQEATDRHLMEEKLGLPPGYFPAMRGEGSDWEFAIKLVVLLEAALGHVLAAHLQTDAVRRHCERLNLSGGRVSKLGLAEDLGILSDAERKAFAALADIRNTFAHRVENINGNLTDFASQMPERAFETTVKAVMLIPPDVANDVRFLWHPQSDKVGLFRYFMWCGASLLLNSLAQQGKHAEAEAQRRKDVERAAEAYKNGMPFTLGQLFGMRPKGGPLAGTTLLTASEDQLKEMLAKDGERPAEAG